MTKISARGDKKIQLKVIPGHFATPQSHITHYLTLTTMRSRSSEALRVAEALAANYETSIPVDTTICMSGLEVVGAYLAEILTRAGCIFYELTPDYLYHCSEYNNSGQIIFRDNIQPMIKNKNILILMVLSPTGETLSRAIESILYYGGTIRGIACNFQCSLPILPDCLFIVFLITGSSKLWFVSCFHLSLCPETETGCIGKWLRLFQDLSC